MVISKGKSALFFAIFIVPAMAVYMIFFIIPFIQGIGISFTNWDGITPKIPNSMNSAEFEEKILNKIPDADKDILLKSNDPNKAPLYRLENGKYFHSGITGLDRIVVEGILAKAGYEPQNNRFVGLDNYKQILSGEVKPEDFYPKVYVKTAFNETSELMGGLAFPKDLFEKRLFSYITDQQDTALLEAAFQKSKDGKSYILSERFEELPKKEVLVSLPGTNPEEMQTLKTQLVDLGLNGKKDDIKTLVEKTSNFSALPAATQNSLYQLAVEFYDLGRIKKLLSTNLVENKVKMGVLGFTIFYTIMNVLLTNLLAFILAMALDKKLKTKNGLRSVFFLPNVLSLVIVAYIWSMVFTYFLGPLTGIDAWMSDPDKAPWLIVFVSVWQGAGYLMVIYLAGLQSIPGEILEAAEVDGANWFIRLKSVTIPLLLPAFTICLFLSLSNSLKAFDLIFILTGGQTGYTYGTVTYVMDVYFDAFQRQAAGMASAKAIILMIVILIVTGIQLMAMKRKEVEY